MQIKILNHDTTQDKKYKVYTATIFLLHIDIYTGLTVLLINDAKGRFSIVLLQRHYYSN